MLRESEREREREREREPECGWNDAMEPTGRNGGKRHCRFPLSDLVPQPITHLTHFIYQAREILRLPALLSPTPTSSISIGHVRILLHGSVVAWIFTCFFRGR